ncbi:MAG: hypothetical protein KKD48_02060 [Nanoarchaeota archaeon]|nr:hypothetical protein [Nanoarchaeota archaeon]
MEKKQNLLTLQLVLKEKLDELEQKMLIPLPSKEVIDSINLLNKDIRDKINFLERNQHSISIEKRRYNRILEDMNKNWPFN